MVVRLEALRRNEAFLGLGRRDPYDRSEPFNMAYLAVRGSHSVNGVARLHEAVSRRLFSGLFPGWPLADVPVGHVTNGIHVPTWHSGEAASLWSETYGTRRTWLGDLEGAAACIADVADERLWEHRAASRKRLVDRVRDRLAHQLVARDSGPAAAMRASRTLDPNALTLGFARRFASYKRPWLMLSDTERLVRLLNDPERPVQLIVAGKAHPDDGEAKDMVRDVVRFAWRDDVHDRVVFLEDYDMALAQSLVAGVDVWVNNPRRPFEASGTSGMKVLVNGGLHCSTLDGWWDEAYEPELGWAIGDRSDHDGSRDDADAEALYEILERHIVPEFYDRDADGIPRRWIERVRASMSRLTAPFSSDRMVRDYVTSAYPPAARAVAARSSDGGRLAAAIDAWATTVTERWDAIRFGRLGVTATEGGSRMRLEVYLGDVPLEAARVEAYADGDAQGRSWVVEMTVERAIAGAVNGYVFATTLPPDRPADRFTPRVVPCHDGAVVPLEAASITWGPRPGEHAPLPPAEGGRPPPSSGRGPRARNAAAAARAASVASDRAPEAAAEDAGPDPVAV